MGNTVTVGKNIEIVFDGSPGNFDIATYFPGEVWLQAVKTKGITSVIVRNGTSTGEILSYFADSVGDGKKDTFNKPKWCKPYILASECTLPSGAVVILEIA
jgi:hypothetical protein